jgi:AcrR family transcriptional regulator
MNQKDHQADRRTVIMQAAINCFIEKGFHTTSMRDIASTAAVSLGNLYNYFPSKQALIAEVANQEQVELAPLLCSLEQASAPAMEQIQQFLAAYWTLCRQPEWAILGAECLAEIARSPALMPKFENNRRQLLDALAGAIERAAQQGIFKPSAPIRLVAQALLDIVESDAFRRGLEAQANSAKGKIDSSVEAMDIFHPGLLRGLLGA